MAKISKLTPVLYKENETDFNHNGLGRLNGLEVYRIEEVLNGEFEALFEYPASGGLAKQIENKMLIKAQPNKKDEPTLFRIYEYELDVATGNYLIYARHKNIDDLGSNLVLDLTVREVTLNQAWNMAKNNAIEPVDISFHSDLLTTSSTIWTRRSLLNCVAGEEGSMIQKWGGEIKHGNNWLWVYRRRGQDNATTVRHGKNLSGLTATYSTKGLTTAIVPYHSYQVENSDEDKVIYGDVVQSQYVNNYPHVYYDAIEYTDEDLGLDSEATETERLNRLNVVAERWFVENTGKDLPSINMVINLEDISQTKEYSKFKDFEQIDLGDTIDVYSEMYKVYVSARIRRVVYNGLTDQNEEVEVGTVSRTIYDDYRELVDERVQEVNKQIQTVQIAANGKNRVFRGPIEPSVGMVKNDIWYKPVGEGEIELYTFDGAYWALEKVSAGLLSGTLDAENGDVNLINVNVANIVGETSEFVISNWNTNGSNVYVDGDGVKTTGANGDVAIMNNRGEFRSETASDSNLYALMGGGRFQAWGDRGSAFQLGADLKNNAAYDFDGGLGVSYNNNFSIGRYDNWSANVTTDGRGGSLIPYLSIMYNGDFNAQNDRGLGEPNGYIRVHKPVTMEKSIYMAGNNISQPYEINFLYGGRIYALSSTSDLRIQSANNISLRTGGDVEKMRIDSTRVYFYQDINMQGNGILEQSDERLKGNFVDASTRDSLGKFKRLNFTYFEWLNESKKRPQGTQFGVKAQEVMEIAPEWVELDPDGYYTINISKMQMESFKAIQQLESENEKLKNEVSEINSELRELKELLKEKGVI
ncbi:phage tail spike protein [Aerococcus viridans]|uniref:phage tail spike protein n=1 Tax=Aerococcus viridans TaxID=1377 RepID=UPI00223B023D|nr:phage tail spike protein [Aerococcus viridans]MCT1797428.1 phage tail protein [Aerococcus viridans]